MIAHASRRASVAILVAAVAFVLFTLLQRRPDSAPAASRPKLPAASGFSFGAALPLDALSGADGADAARAFAALRADGFDRVVIAASAWLPSPDRPNLEYGTSSLRVLADLAAGARDAGLAATILAEPYAGKPVHLDESEAEEFSRRYLAWTVALARAGNDAGADVLEVPAWCLRACGDEDVMRRTIARVRLAFDGRVAVIVDAPGEAVEFPAWDACAFVAWRIPLADAGRIEERADSVFAQVRAAALKSHVQVAVFLALPSSPPAIVPAFRLRDGRTAQASVDTAAVTRLVARLARQPWCGGISCALETPTPPAYAFEGGYLPLYRRCAAIVREARGRESFARDPELRQADTPASPE